MLEVLAKVSKKASDVYTCGTENMSFSGVLPYITSAIILVIQIGVPVLLVIFGMIDLGKAVIAQKEDEIKKNQGLFVKRLLAAIIVFFVVTIVKLVIGLVADDDSNTISNCLNCFIKGEVDSNACLLSTKESGSF